MGNSLIARCILVLAVASSCWGQESKDEVIQKLISRVEALEREIAALKAASGTPAAPAPNEAAAKTPDAPATPTTPAGPATLAPEPPPSADNQNASRFTFHGYADAGFLRNMDGDSVKRFAQGELDLFTTARISPKVNLLMEAVIETDNQILNNDVPINIERALLQYRHNDYFNLDIGSYRTALGFYSTAYLRGSWFQTAVSRPAIFAFEDDGGFLPLHSVGVSVNGRIPSGALGLHYVFEVGSSRNYAQAGRTGTNLEHNGAVNFALFARPPRVSGLQVGFSAYRDKFSPGFGVFFNRSIWTAHAVYHARRLEFLNEVVLEKATAPTLGNANIPGFYSQAAYRVRSNWSPYLRFDYLNVYGKYVEIDALKQYFPWRTIFSGGVRYDLSEAVAFKFELGRETGRFQSPWILVLSAIGAAGLLGSVLAGRALRDAIASTEALYRVDTAGLQLESTLEYETQESRRAFLYALATTDPNDQLPYIDEARLASERVHEATLRLEALGLEEISNCLRRFDRSWRTYSQVRDEIVAHILEGQSDRAIQAERMRGQSSFLAAIQNLHDLRSTLARHVNEKSAQVDRTLRTCAAGLGAFTLCTIFIVGALTKLSRDRHAALEGLWASNEALAAQTEMEERKAAILEMVSIQEPLSHTLGTIVELAPRCAEGAGAAIWSATGAELSFQVACNLPAACIARLQESPLPLAEEHSVLWAELEMGHRTLAAEFGLDTADSKALRDGAGKAIGMLEVLIPPGGRVRRHVVDQIAQLATVAIENKLLYERLAFQAQHDMLTQLPNRASFQNQVEQAAALSMRHGKKLAVLWIDLDRYKQVNDTLGHRVGDEVLCEVARRLKDCLRKSDVVARAGGDEFTVLAYDLASVADAETVAEKILGSLVRPMLLGEHEVAISGSVGISIFPDHGNEPALLLRNADLAMYAAKRAGGNAFSIFQPDLGASLQHRVEIERELRNALERNEFWLEYQPLMNREGGVAGLEALLRWNNPALGRVSPADFIPIAEEMGLIIPIGEWVLRAACQDGAYWSAMSCEVPRIAVNVSAVQLVNKGFRAIVETALRTYGFPANKLEIEITETALMNNLEQATGHMDPLRHLGVRFSVDDFGTGYSSLNQLRTLPVDALKIDRSFIRDLEPSGSGCSTLVEGIIALAHSLNLEVVAEGVETTSQLDLLRSLRCDIYQGFLLARPMPAHQVEALLRRNSPAVEEQLNLVPSLA